LNLDWSDWRFLYLDPKGRITGQAFWVGAVPLLFVVAMLSAALTSLLRAVAGYFSPLVGFGSMGILLVAAWPFWCLAAKRRHDSGGSGVEVAVYMLLVLLLQIWRLTLIDFRAAAPRRFGAARPNIAEVISAIPTSPISFLFVSGAISFFGLTVLAILSFAQGKPGPNRYGPDPRAVLPTAT